MRHTGICIPELQGISSGSFHRRRFALESCDNRAIRPRVGLAGINLFDTVQKFRGVSISLGVNGAIRQQQQARDVVAVVFPWLAWSWQDVLGCCCWIDPIVAVVESFALRTLVSDVGV